MRNRNEPKEYEPPSETSADHVHALARAGISSIPVVGGAGVELFNAVIAPPLRKRQVEWMNDIAEGLRKLEEQEQCVIDDLKGNDTFIDTVMQASQAVLRTAQEDKRKALRNSVLNSALPSSPDDSQQAMFVLFIDTLTVWHLRLLRLFVDPLRWFEENNMEPPQFHIVGSLQKMICGAFPELQGESDLIEQYVSDLQIRGLLSKFSYHMAMGTEGIYTRRGTKLGRQFLEFITAPDNGPGS